jgi:hypothetical protein
MEFEQSQLDELIRQCGQVDIHAEGQNHFILLSKLQFETDGKTVTVDALLCPSAHSGYATRLFLSEQIPSKGNNWNQHQILGRNWHTWSWRDISETQRLAQILAGHLKALI